MPPWVLGVLAVVGFVLLIVVLSIRDAKRKRRTLEEGEPVTGWLVQANSNLFTAGQVDYPAVCLLTPDADGGVLLLAATELTTTQDIAALTGALSKRIGA